MLALREETHQTVCSILVLPQFYHHQSDLPLKTMADVAPITPKKGEYMGLCSAVAILNLCVLSEKMGQVIIREMREGGLSHVGSCQKSPLDLSHKTRHWSRRGLGGYHKR